ncbi:MAG: hypothetical protein WC955_07705 [Elusimicrobiota bacterium]
MSPVSSEELIRALWALGDELRKSMDKNTVRLESCLRELKTEVEAVKKQQQELRKVQELVDILCNNNFDGDSADMARKNKITDYVRKRV